MADQGTVSVNMGLPMGMPVFVACFQDIWSFGRASAEMERHPPRIPAALCHDGDTQRSHFFSGLPNHTPIAPNSKYYNKKFAKNTLLKAPDVVPR